MRIILCVLLLSILAPYSSWSQDQQSHGLKEIRMSEGNGPVSPAYQRKEEFSLSAQKAYLTRTGGEKVTDTGKFAASIPAGEYPRLERRVYSADLEKAKDIKRHQTKTGGGYIVLELFFENGKTYRFTSNGSSSMSPEAMDILKEVRNIVRNARWKRVE
jgi:hypothetical protein